MQAHESVKKGMCIGNTATKTFKGSGVGNAPSDN